METNFADAVAIWIPVNVLDKVTEGLVRNAVENTPDDGQILVTVRAGESGPELEVKDTGNLTATSTQRHRRRQSPQDIPDARPAPWH